MVLRAAQPALAKAWRCLVLGACVGFVPRVAAATEVRIGARTIGESYVVVAPGPEPRLLRRTRLVQYLNLGVYELLPPREVDQWRREDEDGQLEIVASMRVRQDFGDFLRDAGLDSGPVLNSIDGRQIDLMYGYLQGRRLGGFFDFRAGRQFETSGLDWYAFDGGWARANTPAHLAVEVFGGLQVNGAHVFGWPTWELDGTSGNEPADRAGSPMMGAAISLSELRWIHARVAYRRTFTPAGINRNILEPTGAPDGSVNEGVIAGVDQELVSATLNMSLAKGVFSPFAAARFNLGTLRLDDLSAGFGVAVSERHAIRAQYLRTIPSFDLDSIFNLFTLQPFEDVRLSYQVQAGGGWTLLGRGSTRIFRNEPTAALGVEPESRLALGWGGALAALWQRKRFSVRTDAFVQGGEGGLRAGGSVDSQVRVLNDRIGIDLRSYFTRYVDDQVPERQGYGLSFQAGADFKLWDGVHLTLLAEELLTPFLVHAFRGLANLSVDWSFRAGRRGS
ncbi:hypothetical protein ENSA5_42440 [Enhygromyxa salina]|uniref:Alginate export domain-containing protein n=1 Tax=Enhygromyxa salina TaxID=215803 RepID=A0A2S9XMC8_9BACT|nr:hypothetical protein [Enhygromyxa salina]PRP93841.1 hypothetical protein ENSA5_42440 [Enhygromyxa salina]